MILTKMNFTPSDLVLYFGLILTALNIIDRTSILKEKASTPFKQLEARVDALEEKVQSMDGKLKNDNYRIENLEDGGRVLLESMGALLNHAIDGNNTDEMKKARNKLNEYLISK